jgi:hypothetical protein
MGKASVIEDSQPQPEAEAPEITCAHHWIIETRVER